MQYGVVTAAHDSLIMITDKFNPGGTAYGGVVRGYADGVLTPMESFLDSDTAFLYNDVTGLDSSNVIDAEPTGIEAQGARDIRVRGKYMMVANIELQVPIMENQFYMLAFFDAGNSWNHFPKASNIDDKLYRSYGIGFRLMVPGMGTLGFDFGKPLVQFEDDSMGWRPHFQIGTTFK